jgi:putative membrane protein
MRAVSGWALADFCTSAGAWTFDPRLVTPLLAAAVLHLLGMWRLRPLSAAMRESLRRRSLLYWLGFAALGLALLSPLHRAADHLFTAHMIEHELLMVVAAPLLVAARPGVVLLWGLPRRARRSASALLASGACRRLWAGATELWSATALHGLVLWIWHLRGPFEAAAGHGPLHLLQHASFLGSALLFWQAALRPRERAPAAIALFATSLHTGLLGSLLTFSRTPWYPGATVFPNGTNLTPLEDQALAGLVMWILGCSVYALAAVAVTGAWLARMSGDRRHA